MAIRPGEVADSTLKVTRLVSLKRSIMTAPALFDRHGRPERPEDLVRMPAIAFTQLPLPLDWRLSHETQGERMV